MGNKDNFSLKWSSINLNVGVKEISYPVLLVSISGEPSFAYIIDFMRKMQSFTEDFKEKYISITDLSNLKGNGIIEYVLSLFSNKLIRSILFVSNQSLISFILSGHDSNLVLLKKNLTEINTPLKEKDYSYNYHFVEDESQIKTIAEGFLSIHNES